MANGLFGIAGRVEVLSVRHRSANKVSLFDGVLLLCVSKIFFCGLMQLLLLLFFLLVAAWCNSGSNAKIPPTQSESGGFFISRIYRLLLLRQNDFVGSSVSFVGA